MVNLPIGALALALIGLFLRESFQRRQPRIDYAGSLLVLLTLSSLIFGLLQGGKAWPWASLPSVLTFGLAMLAFLSRLLVEQRAAEPVLPGWL